MKKILSFLFAFLLLFTLSAPLLVQAEDGDTIYIRTEKDWNTFAENCTLDSWSSGKTVILSSDLDFQGKDFCQAPQFSGYFDGKGHTIRNISIAADASTCGLFRKILYGTVENLRASGSVTPTGTEEFVGGIAGTNYGILRGCTFEGTVDGIRSVGGICGKNMENARIEGCSMSGTVSGQHKTGGICGENAGTVTGCLNSASVNTEAIENVRPESLDLTLSAEELIDVTDIGGIAGISSGVVTYCTNNGTVGYLHIGYNIGGITGRQSGFTSACINKGKVSGRKDVAGITGQLDPDTNWDFSASNLVQLQGMLADLKGRIDALIADAQWTGDAISSDVDLLLNSISGLGDGALSFIRDLDAWMKLNVDSSIDLYAELEALNKGKDLWFVSKDTLDAMLELTAGFNTDSPSALFSSLQGIETALGALAGLVGDSPLLNDVQSVSDQVFSVSDFVTGMFNTPTSLSSYDYVRDISSDIANRSIGVITDSSNNGAVEAETNAGGVIGSISIDFSFDKDDELNLSALLTGGAKYQIFASAQNCSSTSDITAHKSTSGGIAGKMDYGALINCEATGTISSEGEYAGGIAGYSKGAIHNSRARANISAGRYEGGIAGYGCDIHDCFSMPFFEDPTEYQGSIAGSVEGSVSHSYYTECSVGGIDGFSYEGIAQELPYQDFLTACSQSTLFQTIVLSFIGPDGSTTAITVPFGGQVKNLPSVPDDEDGQKWKWDAFDNTAIYHSQTIGGSYVEQAATLATEGDIPQFLAEGNFYNGQKLTVVPYKGKVDIPVKGDEELSAYTATVENYDQPIQLRMRTENDGDLYIKNGDFQKASYTRNGSYIVFDIQNGGSFAFVSKPDHSMLFTIAGILLGLIIITTVIIIVIVTRRKKAAAEEAAVSEALDEEWTELEAELEPKEELKEKPVEEPIEEPKE